MQRPEMFPEARVRDPRPHMTLFVMSVIAVIALLSFSIGELTERPFSGPEAEILAEPDVQHCDGVIRAIFSVSHPLSPTQEKVWKQTIEAWEKKQPGDVIRHVEIYQGRSRHVIITVMDAI